MAPTLVGAVGAVTQGASGAAVTPAWDAGAGRSQGNLLLCLVASQGSATIPTTPAGWNAPKTQAGTSCAVALFTKVATGGDAAPTIALVASSVLSAQLMEFSGVRPQTAADRSAGVAGTTSPLVATNAVADDAVGELLIYISSAFYSVAATKTLTSTLNNGASANDTNNNATSTVDHYGFGWGITSSKTVADSDSFAYTTTNITGAAVVLASFKLAVASAQPVFLPRSLGPKAVGPTFFAGIPPLTYGASAQPGGPPPPPRTFSRPFFAALTRGRQYRVTPPPVAVPTPVFPTQVESTRNRAFFLIRGRRTFPTQPQIPVPPTIPGNRQPVGRRWQFPVRGRRTVVTPPQEPVWPTRIDVLRSRFTMLRRGRQVTPVPPQVPVPLRIPGNRWSSGRSRIAALAKGRQAVPPLTQATPANPSFVPARIVSKRLLSGLRRGRTIIAPAAQTQPVPPRQSRRQSPNVARGKRAWPAPRQVNPPFIVPRTVAAWRWAALRRGKQTNPVLTQAQNPPPAYPPPKLGAPRRLLSGAQRGRRVTPTPPQITVPKYPPPRTFARWRSAAIRRGKTVTPVPAQQTVTPAYPPGNQAKARRVLGAQPRGRRWTAPVSVPAAVRNTFISLAGFVTPAFKAAVDTASSVFGKTSPRSTGGQSAPASKSGQVSPTEKDGQDGT